MPRKRTTSVPASDNGPLVSPTSQTFNNGDTSALSAAPEASTPQHKSGRTSAGRGDADGIGIDDLLLPRTLTSRLARGILPANTSIQKDALLALTKSATVFISYLASHANEQTTKKTIGTQDVMKALQEIEMGQIMGLGAMGADGRIGGRLERELEVWEGVVRGKRKGYRDSIKAKTRDSEVGATDGDEPELKRVRIDGDSLVETQDQDRDRDLTHDPLRALHHDAQPTSTANPADPFSHNQGPDAHLPSHTNGTSSSHYNDLNTVHTHPHPHPQMQQPGADDLDDEPEEPEQDDDPYQEEDEDVDDETEDDEDEEEGNEEEDARRHDDENDRYGPDEQLRRGMNGVGPVGEVGGTDEEESD